MFIETVPKPNPYSPIPPNPDEIIKIYVHELRKLSEFKRLLRLALGRMQNMEAIFFKGVKNNPDVWNCKRLMHECGHKFALISKKYHTVIKLKHLIIKTGSKPNKYKVQPRIFKRKPNYLL